MRIRVSENAWQAFSKQLLARRDVESAGLLLGELTHTTNGQVIVVRELISLPDTAYRVRRLDQLSLDPVALAPHFRRARQRNLCVLTVHTHPQAQLPWFSQADDRGDARLMPSLNCQIPGTRHGSLVLCASGSAAARVFDHSAQSEPAEFVSVGKRLRIHTLGEHPSSETFDRQVLALGEDGQHALARLRIGVVGLGGTGSLVAMQLAHLGVGGLVLVDGDRVEESNQPRIVGSAQRLGHLKVTVASDYAKSVGFARHIGEHAEPLSAQHDELIAGCDLVFSCVDRQSPRALLNQLAYRHLVPVIDMGTAFRVEAPGTIVGDAGRVVVVGPGRACLACWGHLDPAALRNESLPDDDLADLADEGYIQGSNISQPSVMPFNAAVASAAVIEALRLVTGFAGADSPPERIAFSFASGTARRNRLSPESECRICGHPPNRGRITQG